MRKTTPHAAITLPAGVRLELTKPQALARERVLHRAGKNNVYLTLAPVTFKAGESFGYDGDLPKALAAQVDIAPAKLAALPIDPPVLDLAS